MTHLFREWENIRGKIEKTPVCLMLDFDGTLAAIRRDPDKAHLSAAMVRTLEDAARTPGIALSIISGRSLKDIKKRTGVSGVTYAGNHGLEIKGAGIAFTSSGALKIKRDMKTIAVKLRKALRGIKGVIVEDKGLTVSVHFRMVAEAGEKDIEKLVKKVTAPYAAKKDIKVMSGKKIWEVRPLMKWDKGSTALFIVKKKRAAAGSITPVYIGDDRTDEDAFRAIGKSGICVFVGGTGRSSASYYLKGTAEVRAFIRRIIRVKKRRK